MAHPDLDRLLSTMAVPARCFLADRGDFEPFAAVLDENGETHLFGGELEADAPRELALVELERALRDLAREESPRAVGVCWIAFVERGESGVWRRAIAAGLEHAEGESVNVFQPCDVQDGEWSFGEAFASRRERAVLGAERPRLRLLELS